MHISSSPLPPTPCAPKLSGQSLAHIGCSDDTGQYDTMPASDMLFVHRTRECYSTHSWAEPLFSQDDLQLISPSEHVWEGEEWWDKRGGRVEGCILSVSFSLSCSCSLSLSLLLYLSLTHKHTDTQSTGLACWQAMHPHKTGPVLSCWTVLCLHL